MPTALINILVTLASDGPATHTHNKMCNTANITPVDSTTASINDTVNMPPLTKDRKDTLRLMQRMDPFCKQISKRLLSGKAPHMK